MRHVLLPSLASLALMACIGARSADQDGGGATGESAGTSGSQAGGAGTGAGGTTGAAGTGGAGDGAAGRDGGAGGTTGAAGTAGVAGAGGSAASGASVCKFANGLNIAWVNFANDVPNPATATFQTIFQDTAAAGGRVVRWWLHTNGTVTPGYDSNGMASPLSTAAINGVVTVLNAAHAAGVAINLSLWSFDMLQGGENISTTLRTNNQNLLTVDANRTAYINNALIPLVNALKGNPGLYSYEIFNEPEGMTTQNGWTAANGGTEVDESAIQRTVNWLASAIHTADPSARVTNAAWTFKACANGVSGMSNFYSDSALVAAGGMANGTLDFYEVHYYAANGSQFSCFTHPASFWGLDKKLVMGEFYAITTDGVDGSATYTTLLSSGYNGGWAWQYESNDNNGMTTKWPTMQAPMQAAFTADTADVNACP